MELLKHGKVKSFHNSGFSVYTGFCGTWLGSVYEIFLVCIDAGNL